jgi:hypothetical protein
MWNASNLVAAASLITALSGTNSIYSSDSGDSWKEVSSFFKPPDQYAGQFGSFRSPLISDDGKTVKNAPGWARRRAGILRAWNDLMGSWPTLIERPKVEILSESRRENFLQKRVRLEIGPGQIGEGWLLIPDGNGRRPAALVVYYEPETSIGLKTDHPFTDFGLQLARRGFVTLSIGTPGGDAWKPEIGKALCQPLSYHAYIAANCWHALSDLPQVDSKRIGIVGHSYGGKWAMFGAALWEKFACVAVSDPGIIFDENRPNVNYWEPWYLGFDPAFTRKPGVPTKENARTGAYKKMIDQGRDLHEIHALICPRPFLVSGGSEDTLERWSALNHAIALNRLLGFENRVGMTNRPAHAPTAESTGQICKFFEHFLQRK